MGFHPCVVAVPFGLEANDTIPMRDGENCPDPVICQA